MARHKGTHEVWGELAPDAQLEGVQLVAAARSMIVARRALHGPLPADLIHDPALDMLLALFVAEAATLDREALLSATTVPASVGSRWLAAIAADGLADADDNAIRLSDAGKRRVADALRAVIASQVALHAH